MAISKFRARLRAEREEQRIAQEHDIASRRKDTVITDDEYQELEMALVLMKRMIRKDGLRMSEYNALNSAIHDMYILVNAGYSYDVSNPAPKE